MDHTIGAFFISTGPVLLPLRQLHQLPEGCRIPFLKQITGLLPSEDVIGGIPPGCTLVLTFAHEEIQKQRGLIELPTSLGIRKNLGKKLLGS